MPALKKEKGIFSWETVEVEWERTETLVVEYNQSILYEECHIEKLNSLKLFKNKGGLIRNHKRWGEFVHTCIYTLYECMQIKNEI
jgi:hypothetical protein